MASEVASEAASEAGALAGECVVDDDLQVGDILRFAGEYEWNERGGVLHWTHHDPRGKHAGGWLELAGRRYQ